MGLSRETLHRRTAAERLRELRRLVREARQRQKAAEKATRARCRRLKAETRERIRAFKAAERERLRREVHEMREAARADCAAAKARAHDLGEDVIGRRKARVEAQRAYLAATRAAAQHERQQRASVRARQRAAESDDAVRRNLPDDLVPVFNAVKASVRGGPRRSRTEAFLEWSAENPGEVIAIQATRAERAAAAEIAAHERELRAAHRRKTRRRSAALQEEVPF